MKLMRICKLIALFATVAFVWTAMQGNASAQSSGECLCLVPAALGGQTIGSIINANGQVQVSQTAGFGPGSAGTALFQGNRIIVGPASNALISVGPNCRLRIPENTDVSLNPVDGNICVGSTEATGNSAGQTTTAQTIGRIIIGGVVIGGWVDIAVSH